MVNVYLRTGMFLRGLGGYYYEKGALNTAQEGKWKNVWRKTELNTRPRYNPNNIRLTRAKGISGMAWGQGELIATPASVARLVAGVANKGVIVPNRYVLKISDSTLPVKEGVKLTADPQYAALITSLFRLTPS